MPLHLYRCATGHEDEQITGWDAPATTECPVCGAEATRTLGAPSVHFKGQGFYTTDYARTPSARARAALQRTQRKHA